MSMHKVLFWDFDGTLVFPNEAYSIALDRALRVYGYEIPFDEIRRCTRVIPWHTNQTIYPHPAGDAWWEVLQGRMTPFFAEWQVPEAVYEEVFCRYREELNRYEYRLFDDALDTMETCRKMDYECHLLSNNHPDLPQILERMGLRERFGILVIGSLFGYDKPRTELFRYAMAEAGEPEEAWMIGDNPECDIKGAKEAGLRTIWVGHRWGQETGERYADAIVDSLSEIPAILAQK